MSDSQWSLEKIKELFAMPFASLIFTAQSLHRQHFNPNEVELCTIISIKTGACPEDCGYCSQSGHYQTLVERERLLVLDKVIQEARQAKENGATRFCMGAAWRNPSKKDLPKVIEMIKSVKELGLETCVTLGMLDEEQAKQLQVAGLDFYNHNLDTSPNYYKNIITTHTYQDRLETLNHVRKAGIHVCCGCIIGMGESREDRIALLNQLANLPEQPKSVPINRLIPFKGTPLQDVATIDNIEFIRTIAVARIILPKSVIRLSGGRATMSEEMQALCFIAGANSMWLGNKLLTATNREHDKDLQMLNKLGIKAKQPGTARTQSLLSKLKTKNLVRNRYVLEKKSRARIKVQGNWLVNFCSNDYLNISADKRVKKALVDGVNKYGFGSCSSALVSGYSKEHQLLEEKFAEFLQREQALVFNSGYHANLGVITTFANKQSTIIADKFCHASLIDGSLLSRAKFYRYRHNDLNHAEQLLQNKSQALLLSESVFSMQGHIADIDTLVKLAKKYHAMLIVDDAHGFGILGEQGQGICEHYHLTSHDIPCLIIPLGKSLGSFGAVIAGNCDMIETVIQSARTYRYSTLLPAALCKATLASLQIVQTESWRRSELLNLLHFFDQEAHKRGLHFISQDATPIKSLVIGDNQTALDLQKKLKQQGLLVSCIRPPTVPHQTARLRISITIAHNKTQIARLLDQLKEHLTNE